MANPLQYSYLENPTDRRPCQTTVHGVAESDTTGATWHAPGILTWGEGRCVSRTWAGGDGVDAPNPCLVVLRTEALLLTPCFCSQLFRCGRWVFGLSIFCP